MVRARVVLVTGLVLGSVTGRGAALRRVVLNGSAALLPGFGDCDGDEDAWGATVGESVGGRVDGELKPLTNISVV